MTFHADFGHKLAQRFLERLSQTVLEDEGPKIQMTIDGAAGKPTITIATDDPACVIFEIIRKLKNGEQ